MVPWLYVFRLGESSVYIRAVISILCIALFLVVLIPGAFAATLTVGQGQAYTAIQEAIDNASPGDTVQVNSGTYYENVVVNKTLNLIGFDNGTGMPTVDGMDGYAAIMITADGVTIHGFEITDACDGIYITSSYNNLTGNTIYNNSAGIYPYSSNFDDISGNTINNNLDGIYFLMCSNNTIWGNTVNNNDGGGIYDFEGSGNNISMNMANNNVETGIYIRESDNCVVSGNTINNNGLDGIRLGYYSINNNISGNIASNNSEYGISVEGSSYNDLLGNTANNNGDSGICLFSSGYNNVSGNAASTNGINGIFFYFGIYNDVSLNIFKNNTLSDMTVDGHDNVFWLNVFEKYAVSGMYSNYWNSTIPLQYTYDGKSFINYTGNYWSDYNGVDTNGDGIGDTSNEIGAYNIDYYPMVLANSKNNTSFTLSLARGWNLVSSPLVFDPAVNVSMFKGTNVTMLAKYNQTTGGFDIYRVGKTPVAFPFVEGQGYFLYCGNDMTYTINGYSEQGQSTTIGQGWNLIGWTNIMASNSKMLASGLQNVTMLARYNTTSGSYDIYRVGKTPTPFTVQAGEGYFLYTTYNSPQTLVMA